MPQNLMMPEEELDVGFAIAHARTSYFKVRDEVAFRRWAEACGFLVYSKDGAFMLGFELEDAWVLVAHPASKFLQSDPPQEGEPGDQEDEDGYEDDDFDFDREFAPEVAQFLAPGSIAILFRAGGGNRGDVFGDAVAVDCEGRSVEVSIFDAIQRARQELGGEVIDPHEVDMRVWTPA